MDFLSVLQFAARVLCRFVIQVLSACDSDLEMVFWLVTHVFGTYCDKPVKTIDDYYMKDATTESTKQL